MGRCPTPTGRDDENNNLKKGAWTPEEDQILIDYIQAHGHGSWRALPKLAGDHSSVSLSLSTRRDKPRKKGVVIQFFFALQKYFGLKKLHNKEKKVAHAYRKLSFLKRIYTL